MPYKNAMNVVFMNVNQQTHKTLNLHRCASVGIRRLPCHATSTYAFIQQCGAIGCEERIKKRNIIFIGIFFFSLDLDCISHINKINRIAYRKLFLSNELNYNYFRKANRCWHAYIF